MRRSAAHLSALSVALTCAIGGTGCESTLEAIDAGSDAGSDASSHADGAPAVDAGPPPPHEIADCTEAPAPGFAPLRPRCQLFVDDEGRATFLRGVNARVEGLFDVTFDDGRVALEPIPELTDDDARRMRALGLNFLRLPIHWSAIEPVDATPRVFVEAYVERLRAVLDVCRAHGIFVLVDWHQDAYSKEIGEDGAPLWAISPPPTMLLEGPLEDLAARRSSAQVLAAFDTFFGDGAVGETLRARFGEAVAHVVEALEGDEIVVGFEIYNEPVAGDAATRRLNEQIAAVIHAADPRRLSFFEPPSVPRNFTDRAALATRPFDVPGGVYAPHSYTLSFGGTDEQRRTFTRETLRVSHANAEREARSWGTPLLIGEWGYDPNGIRAEEYFTTQVELMDEYAESWALWVWKEESQGSWGVHDHDETTGAWSERRAIVDAISRPRPERIAGWPRRFGFDAARGVLEVRYRGDSDVVAPTVVYLPERAPTDLVFECDGATLVAATRDAATGLVEVPCAGEGEHVVRVLGLDGL